MPIKPPPQPFRQPGEAELYLRLMNRTTPTSEMSVKVSVLNQMFTDLDKERGTISTLSEEELFDAKY